MNDEQIEALRTKYGFNKIGIIEGEMYLPMKEVFEKLVQRWIPCSERLPEKYEEVVVTDGYSMMVWNLTEGYDGYSWEDEHGGWNDFEDVIAWMPLPAPYQEEGEVHE